MRGKVLKAFGIAVSVGLLLTACAGSGSGGASGDGASAGGEPIVVAHVGDISGDWSFYDAPVKMGLEMAADEINADGGINGSPVEFLSIDSHGQQADAVRGVEDAIDAGAVYIVGTTNPGDWQAQASIACQEGVPISTGDGSSGTLVPNAGDCALHVIMRNGVQVGALTEYAAENDMTTAYLLESSDDAYHLELAELFKIGFEEAGGTIIGSDEFQHGSPDFNVQVANIAALPEQPDFIFTSMYFPDPPQFVRQLRTAGIETPILSPDGFVDSALLETSGAAEGLVATYHAWPSDNNDIGEFIEGIDANTSANESPEHIIAALGYDEMYMIKSVIEEQGEATPESVLEGFKNLSFEGVTGEMIMDPETRQADKEIALIQVQDGEYVFLDSFIPEFIPSTLD